MKKSWVVGLGVFAAIGCRGGGGGGGGGMGTIDAPPQLAPIAIKDLRQNPPAAMAPVALKDVVVVARVTSHKYGSVWVQDQGGGKFSGIHIFCNYGGKTPNCTMTQAQLDALQIGQLVSITGKYDPYTPKMPANAQPQLEISSPVITTGSGMMAPFAIDVTPDQIAKDQFSGSSSDSYKGTLVHVTGGPYMVSNVMAPEFQATCMDMAGMVGTTYYGFEVSGGGKTLALGTNFYSTLTYCLPQCGYPCTNPVTNQSFTSVTGIVEPDASLSAGTQFLKISPVQDSDLPHS